MTASGKRTTAASWTLAATQSGPRIVSVALIRDRYQGREMARVMSFVMTATPIGMHPHEDDSVIPKALLHDRLAVMDIVYNPLKTRMLRDAEANGLRTIPGVEMFVNQAVLQFERFTGEDAPVEVMRKVVLESLSS